MRRWGTVLILALTLSVVTAAHPSFVPTDPPVAFVQGDPGRTTFSLTLAAQGWTATVARSVSAACDVVAVVSSTSPFDLRVRVLGLTALFPLQAAFEIGWGHFAFLSALDLGPIRLVGERRWGADGGVRVALHAVQLALAVAAGVESGPSLRPFVAATWLPSAIPLWGITLTVAPAQCRLSLGGSW